MIRDLSLSLRALLTRGVSGMPELAAAEVAFDRPADTYNPAQPTINLYLYDIRENVEMRTGAPDVRIVNGRAEMRRPPLRVACTYLVTAWAGNVTGDELALREHRLLSQALMMFWRHPVLPSECLVGQLVGQPERLPMITARAEGLANPSEFWSSLNNRMRPSLSISVTLAMAAHDMVTAPLATSHEIILRNESDAVSDRFRIGGRVTDAAQGAVTDATVDIAALGLTVTTDVEGRYILGPVPAGSHLLRVRRGMNQREVSVLIPAANLHAYDIQLN